MRLVFQPHFFINQIQSYEIHQLSSQYQFFSCVSDIQWYYLYGERIANGTNQQFHPGVDISYYEGAPIYALYGGTVVYSGGTYGTVSIRVPSQNNIVTNYIHMKNIPVVEGQTVNAGQIKYVRSYYLHMIQTASVKEGDSVKKGDVIGYVGSTGDSTGNHLHLGTRYSNAQFTVGGDFYEGVDFFNPTELIGT